MNIPTFWSRYNQLKSGGAQVTLTGFGKIRAASKQSGAIYFRVQETPSRLRVINTSNNVQIKDGTSWLDTGVGGALQGGTQPAGQVLAVLIDIANRLGISVPTSIPEGTQPVGGGAPRAPDLGDGGSGDGGTDLDTWQDQAAALPVLPMLVGAGAGYYIGKSMKKPMLGAAIGAAGGYYLGTMTPATDG